MSAPPSILVIDDDEALRTMMALALTGAGFAVTVASDGRKGLRAFHENPAELVITDIVMPETEGMGVIMELRRDYPVVGLIAMSGHTAHSSLYLSTAKKMGAHAIFPKPFTIAELLKVVTSTRALMKNSGVGEQRDAGPGK
jgi:DNA-binding response OmpR family regulator